MTFKMLVADEQFHTVISLYIRFTGNALTEYIS